MVSIQLLVCYRCILAPIIVGFSFGLVHFAGYIVYFRDMISVSFFSWAFFLGTLFGKKMAHWAQYGSFG